MELVRGGTSEWYWATDYVHGDLYEAEELFRQKNSVQSNRLYLIHYPDGMVYEPVLPVDGQYLGYPVFDGESVVLLVVNFTESAIHILRFLHQQEKTQEVVRLPLSAVKDCYNLILHPSPLSLTRQPNDGTFEIIWPEQIRFAISSRETLNFRDGDKLYFSIWYEDPDYREETLVRSAQDGTILERFSGDIRIMPNRERWLYQIVLVVQHYSSKISVYLNTFPQQHIFPSNNKKRSSANAEERLLFSLNTAAPRRRRGPRSCSRGRRWAGSRGSRA